MATVESNVWKVRAKRITLGLVIGMVLVILASTMVLCVTMAAISMWDVSQYAGSIWN